MATKPDGDGEGGGGGHSSGLFPLFSSPANSISATSGAPQWLSNTSFTVDPAIINAIVPEDAHADTADETEDGDSDGKNDEAKKPRSYDLVGVEREDYGSSGESDGDEEVGKRRKKKKKRKRKSSVKDSEEYYPKPAKDYYMDTRPDHDNLVYGSIYRMDIPRYKRFNPDKSLGSCSQMFYLRFPKSSMLDRDNDVDALDVRAKSNGRYWSAKYAALEGNKNFKRARFSSPRETADASLDYFIPLEDTETPQESGDGDALSKSSVIEASWEDEVLNKTREFNRLTREHPHDEKAWLAFAEFQDKVSNMQPQKGVRLQTLEKKISILEKAFQLNPDSEDLLIALLKAYRSRDNADVLVGKWEKALMQHSTSYKLWREFLRVLQGEFSRFKVSEVRKMYSHAFRALSHASSKRHRQVDITSEPLDQAVIQQELVLVDMLVSLCRFEWQAGYQELATALFQAEIEFSIFSPSLLLSEQSKQRLFEHYWSSNCARVGEEGALGWSLWLEKEEENRQRILREESSDNDDAGGWTGWTEPLSAQKGGVISPVNAGESDVPPEGLEEEVEHENSKLEDDTEAMLKLLGIDVKAGDTDEVKDTSTWVKWFEEEVSRDHNQWMPVRKAGETSNIDETIDGEIDDQISSIVLYEDISEYLFSLSSAEARLSLLYQFIDFFGGHMSPWTSSNSVWWTEKMNSMETLVGSALENLKRAHEDLMKSENGHDFSLVFLLSGTGDISMRTKMMKFLRNAILLCLTVFPRNYILEEAVLVAEELFVTNMRTCEVSTTPCQALAKRLLKSDRQDFLLCGVYARREVVSGNMNHARRVFDMALSSISGLTVEMQSKAPLLYLWYAESEVANSSGKIQEKESSSRAIHILCCVGSDRTYSPYNCQPSSVQLLRARQGFKEKLKKIQSTWAHGIIDDQSAATVCSAALFEEMTNGFSGAVEILDEAFSAVLPGRKSQSHHLELLISYYVRMVHRYQDHLSFSKLLTPISEGLQLYPLNPELYRALVEICHHRMTSHKLRMMFDDYSRKKPSLVVWLFALSYEMNGGGSRHRIRGLFERALSQDALSNSVLLWRCYIAYEIEIGRDPSAARRVYFRAINACPWSKKLWLEGFARLKSVLTAKEMSDIQEVMRDKELNIRTDIYEILLQT
ncbi:PREDICTED: protein NRDE2 homolog isoform X2 [Tarenaya hassleriana]|uniref:protein NRDE2 homolog isoform X2 n=1 Tax=Tarenaya hassleriana TaxID=28532 RepID=UPI00053C76B0|nr:PREDICTED: protein NRDE2 homolog isoform X2 [Tarenaya hassleriana]